MSHFSVIATKITDKQCLIEALHQLEYNVEENSVIRGYQGQTREGEVVVKTSNNFDIGFTKDKQDAYSVVADWWGLNQIGIQQKSFCNSVTKEYAVQKVIKETKNKGFTVSSRKTTENGEIKLLVVKRGWSS